MTGIIKCFEILGLKPEASLEEVKEAYRDLVKVWHPDRFANDPKLQAKAQEKLQEINEAYNKVQEFLADLQGYQQAGGSRQETSTKADNGPQDHSKQYSESQNKGEQHSNSRDPQADKTTENEKNMQNLYGAMVGEKNRPYYLTKFKQFDQQGPGLKASWNWSAFFCGGFWALYRKMYGWFFIYWGIAILSTMIEKGGAPVWGALVLPVSCIAFTIFANSLYHKKIKKQIAQAQLNVKDPLKLFLYLRPKGGVLGCVIWIVGWLFVIGVLAAIIIPMFGPGKKEAEEWLVKGEACFSSNDYDGALAAFSKAIKITPKDPSGYMKRGAANMASENYVQGILDFSKVIELDPKNVTAYIHRGGGYIHLKNYSKAIEDHNRAIELDPKNVTAYIGRGYAYSVLGKYSKSIEDYDRALELDPSSDSAYRLRRYVHDKLGKEPQ